MKSGRTMYDIQHPRRRQLLASALAAALPLAVHAEPAWPASPIELIVPFAPGGTVNLMARAISSRMSELLGQPVVVDNKAGAGGTLGAAYVARAPADGYTLLLASMNQSVQPFLYKKLSFDAARAFTPVARFASVPNVLAVSMDTPARTVAELVAYARSHPGKLNMGSAGIGSINHLTGELFMQRTGVSFTHIPYKGASPAVTDMQAGQIQVIFANLPNMLPFAKAGKLRLLAVASDRRSPAIPDVPTFAEAGVKDAAVDSWYAVMAPAGTSPQVVKKLQDAMLAVAAEKQFASIMADQGAQPSPGNTAELAQLLARESQRWSAVLRDTNIRMD